MFVLVVLIFVSRAITGSSQLFCNDILENSDDKLYTTEDLKSMSGEEVSKCLAHLGRVKMPIEQAKVVWWSLVDFYGSASAIPEDKLNTLHWITLAIEPEEYVNLTMSSIDIIENFGLYYDLSVDQINAIANRVRQDWGDKSPEDYTSYDLTALKQIICAFNSSEILRIHPLAYKDAASALSLLRKCSQDVLEALAQLAVDEKAFGPVETWDENIVSIIGVVINGLSQEDLAKISKNAMMKGTKIIEKLKDNE